LSRQGKIKDGEMLVAKIPVLVGKMLHYEKEAKGDIAQNKGDAT